MRSSDLPDGTKRQLLSAIRDKIGRSQYDSMVDTVGEDRMLDMLLDSANKQGSTSGRASRSSTPDNVWAEAFDFVWKLLLENWIVVLVVCVSGGPVGILTVLGVLPLLYFGHVFLHAVGALEAASTALAVIVGIGVGGAALVGLGYLLWIGVPWIISGVGQWWSWLGGHFQ